MPDRRDATAARQDTWGQPEDEAADEGFKRLSREEAAALRARHPSVSPWRVIAVQAVVGVAVALIGRLLTGRSEVAWSLLYGAAAVVVPGALMARGMTRKRPGMTAGSLAVSFMLWELVKIGVSVAMLGVANWILQPPHWPALLVGLVVALKMYWAALLMWRRSKF